VQLLAVGILGNVLPSNPIFLSEIVMSSKVWRHGLDKHHYQGSRASLRVS
jgi:hypothetical protein